MRSTFLFGLIVLLLLSLSAVFAHADEKQAEEREFSNFAVILPPGWDGEEQKMGTMPQLVSPLLKKLNACLTRKPSKCV